MMLHLQVAEAGKRRMLAREYDAALDRYRAALQLAVGQRAPAVFLHHYTDCILDCLELSGDHEQALALTERALDDQNPNNQPLGKAVEADLRRRRVLLLFALGRAAEGDVALAATELPDGPVITALRNARRRRLTIDARWIADLKRRHSMSSVTEEHLRGEDAEQGEIYFQKEFSYG